MPHISQYIPGPGERVITFGGTRSGKSSWMDWEMREIQRTRPECMQILVDTKPRFRAETMQYPANYSRPKWRKSAEKQYRAWSKGPVVPNSVKMDLWRKNPFAGLWQEERPGEIVIMQGGELRDWVRMLKILHAFVGAQIKGRERRLIADEVLDFYGRNTFGIDMKHDVFYRTARAGGERNIGLELGAHRVHGMPPLILMMGSRVNLFHLRYDRDLRHLRDTFGIEDAESPKGAYVFRQWTVAQGGFVSDPATLRATYPESYLNQLSAT